MKDTLSIHGKSGLTFLIIGIIFFLSGNIFKSINFLGLNIFGALILIFYRLAK